MANTFLEDRVLRALDSLSALNTLANPQEPNYWEKLKHQYAGMAMQGMLNNSLLITGLLKVNKSHEDIVDEVTGTAVRYAHALVEKLKEKEEKE